MVGSAAVNEPAESLFMCVDVVSTGERFVPFCPPGEFGDCGPAVGDNGLRFLAANEPVRANDGGPGEDVDVGEVGAAVGVPGVGEGGGGAACQSRSVHPFTASCACREATACASRLVNFDDTALSGRSERISSNAKTATMRPPGDVAWSENGRTGWSATAAAEVADAADAAGAEAEGEADNEGESTMEATPALSSDA